MDWESPLTLLLIFPALAFLLWAERGSSHPMSAERKRALLILRSVVILALIAIARTTRVVTSARRQLVA